MIQSTTAVMTMTMAALPAGQHLQRQPQPPPRIREQAQVLLRLLLPWMHARPHQLLPPPSQPAMSSISLTTMMMG